LKILIIGGTIFLGRHLVIESLKRHHNVTLFFRGKHNPNLFSKVDKILGDRERDLEMLAGKNWDVVIDTCGYLPRITAHAAEFFRDKTELYVFISTLSVYRDFSVNNIDETYPVGQLNDPLSEELNGETYGPLKALCEKTITDVFRERALIIRPGLIVGSYDPTDRFTSWVNKIFCKERIIAPGRQDRQVQFIDVRDLASWIIRLIENNVTGIFNAVGPSTPLTMSKLLNAIKKEFHSYTDLIWVNDKFLIDEGIVPYSEMPLWIPDSPESVGYENFSFQKAVERDLTFLPLEDTIHDTIDWFLRERKETVLRAGLADEKERDLLRKWFSK